MKHSAECEKQIAQRRQEIADYGVQNPNYCRHCGGHGGASSSFDPSPAGVSLGAGWMSDFEPCPECSEKGICSVCASPVAEDVKCPCGGHGIPSSPECFCWEEEDRKYYAQKGAAHDAS